MQRLERGPETLEGKLRASSRRGSNQSPVPTFHLDVKNTTISLRILLLCLALVGGALSWAPAASAEPPECGDGVDNDGDGFTDYPNDPECDSAEDSPEIFGDGRFPTHITIRYDRREAHFIGELGNVPRGCLSDRLVRLKRPRQGRDHVVDRDRTDAHHVWVIRKKDAHGKFYAVAPRSERARRDGTTVQCARITSVTIIVR